MSSRQVSRDCLIQSSWNTNHLAPKRQVWSQWTTSTTIASGKLSNLTLLKVPVNKWILQNAWRMWTSLSSSWSSNKCKTSTCTPTKKLTYKSLNNFTTDLSSKKTSISPMKSTFLFLSQELQSRWTLTLSGPQDSPWVRLDISQLKSGLCKIKMSQELLPLPTRRLDYWPKSRELIRNQRSNSSDKMKVSSKD